MQTVQANGRISNKEIIDLTTRVADAAAGLKSRCDAVTDLQVQAVEMTPGRVTYHLVVHTHGGRAMSVASHVTRPELDAVLVAYALIGYIVVGGDDGGCSCGEAYGDRAESVPKCGYCG